MTLLDDKCQNLQMSLTNVCASFYRFRDITILKSRSRSRSAIFAFTPLACKCKNL